MVRLFFKKKVNSCCLAGWGVVLKNSSLMLTLYVRSVKQVSKFSDEEVKALFIVVKNEQLIRTSKATNDPASQDRLDPSKPYFELYK